MDPSELLYTSAQVRALDRVAIERHGVPAAELMARAGATALDYLRTRWPRATRLAVICGPGNNGGDGYVLARLARAAGLHVQLCGLGTPRSEEGAAARRACERAGMRIEGLDGVHWTETEVVVDALLGTGLVRRVEGEIGAAIRAINASGRLVLALDVPSGLNADTGAVMGAAVRATATTVFIGLKAGLYTGAGREYAGQIHLDDLGVPSAVYEGLHPIARRLNGQNLSHAFCRRHRDGHKGDYGHVLVIGGDQGMPGAARLAGEAAYRAGAGLVTVAANPVNVAAIATARPELLIYGVEGHGDLMALVERCDVIALGPGLGRRNWGTRLLGAALEARRPLVVDADALNLLATDPTSRHDWVLTPHPGEAARLLGTDVAEIQADRFAAVRALGDRYGGVIVLKGSGTLVARAGEQTAWLCDQGNPGMASGGTGDVLTGTIAGLLAQGLTPLDAARAAVWAHAAAGDEASAVAGEAGLLATDLLDPLRRRLNALRDGAYA